ncbi:MAG: squalene--hopene cyclase [Gemmataceae bacterium]
MSSANTSQVPHLYTSPISHFRRDDAHGTDSTPLSQAILRARCCLVAQQRDDGHWVAELQGDTILESEYLLLMAFLGREEEEICQKAAEYLFQQQMPNGGWNNYPGGPADLSTTVKGYFALKLMGHNPAALHMKKARDLIRSKGGAIGCNSFTKFYLALLGEFPYENCPAVPPEMIFLPKWAYINLYAMSSWTRTIVVPLTLFYAHKPVRNLPPERGIAELFLDPPQTRFWPQTPTKRWLTWHNFFLVVDQIFKVCDPSRSKYTSPSQSSWWSRAWNFVTQPLTYLRAKAVEKCEAWMLEHFADSDGVGAIFPPMIYTVLALHCLGYAEDSPEMQWAHKQLTDLVIEENETIRLQPCVSPVWDTAIALNALAFASTAEVTPAIDKAVEWLLGKEVRREGDWSLLNPNLEPAGWFFEYRNGFYPDTDDTAMVLMGLARTGHAFTGPEVTADTKNTMTIPAARRGVKWLLGMQNSDGGWAAFDRDINREILTEVPFADHNAMLDPSCPDITARILEALAEYGYRVGQPEVDRAIEFIAKHQDERGCWIGRWGVNYIYGTWQVLVGLATVGFDMQHPMVRRGVEWLKQVQQPRGGWGETCGSYDDPGLAGQGEPTPSQTGWALLGLLAAGEENSREVKQGIQYLLETQREDGNWDEDQFTGTGFPKVFYLKYHNYRLYFPLMALAKYQQLTTHQETPKFQRKLHIKAPESIALEATGNV